jgi:chaperonin GroES
MRVRPARGKAFVRLHETESVTKGGILLPESTKKKKAEGTVVAVGPGKYVTKGPNIGAVLDPPVKENDVVVLPSYQEGYENMVRPLGWEAEGEAKLLVVDTDNILAVIDVGA